MREVDHRLAEAGEMSLADYAILITLVTAPGLRLRMSELGTRSMLSASGITRVVMRLEQSGWILREPDPRDGRGAFAALTRVGLESLRRAQVVHHETVRELYLHRLSSRELERLAGLYEKALPGVVSAPVWPEPPRRSRA